MVGDWCKIQSESTHARDALVELHIYFTPHFSQPSIFFQPHQWVNDYISKLNMQSTLRHGISHFRTHSPRALIAITLSALKPSSAQLSYRGFSTTISSRIRTIDMSQQDFKDVKIDRERLWSDLHTTCEWGKGERWGE